jgi:hypothetical protein
MNVRIDFRFITTAAAAISLASCAGGNHMTQKIRQFSINDLRPARVDVVEVREKDLKPLPTGEERALAYQRSQRRFFGFFDFIEPELPAEGLPMDGALLPSLD